MKNRYIVVIILAILSVILVINYQIDVFPFGGRNMIINRNYKWSFTGESFITTYTDYTSPVTGAKSTHSCLAGNDESCFLITVWSGNYASYFNSYWIAVYDEMINAEGSEVTVDDMKAQLKAGYIEVQSFDGPEDSEWHLVDIGLESQHLYIERPWGTLIVRDMLGMKGPSHEDRRYIPYTDMPQYIDVK